MAPSLFLQVMVYVVLVVTESTTFPELEPDLVHDGSVSFVRTHESTESFVGVHLRVTLSWIVGSTRAAVVWSFTVITTSGVVTLTVLESENGEL